MQSCAHTTQERTDGCTACLRAQIQQLESQLEGLRSQLQTATVNCSFAQEVADSLLEANGIVKKRTVA